MQTPCSRSAANPSGHEPSIKTGMPAAEKRAANRHAIAPVPAIKRGGGVEAMYLLKNLHHQQLEQAPYQPMSHNTQIQEKPILPNPESHSIIMRRQAQIYSYRRNLVVVCTI